MQEIKLFAVVLKMAAHAILAIGILHLHLCVIAMFGRKALGYFLVTIKTFKRRCAGAKLMATGALGRAAQGLVSSRKWSWGNLAARAAANQEKPEQEEHESEGSPGAARI
jgi:hypothetical protein